MFSLNFSKMGTELLNLVAFQIVVGGLWWSRNIIAALTREALEFRKAGGVLGGCYLNFRSENFS
jgi:hypothetical protein